VYTRDGVRYLAGEFIRSRLLGERSSFLRAYHNKTYCHARRRRSDTRVHNTRLSYIRVEHDLRSGEGQVTRIGLTATLR